MNDPITVKLSRPLNVVGDVVDTLTIREPNGRDLREIGYPMTFHDTGGTEVNSAVMARMIGRLAGTPKTSSLPLATVDMLSVADWNACMAAVLGFFGGAASSSTDTTSAPAGGATS